MTTLQLNERVFPTDLLFRNFFDTNSMFQSFVEQKPNYPVDIYTSGNELCFDIACVGLEKSDINITTEGNTLKIAYSKPNIDDNPSDEEAPSFMHRGIARRSFDMGWKVSPDFDLSKLDATMKNGLLQITVPKSENAKAKFIEIN